jgi:hypothetical protein
VEPYTPEFYEDVHHYPPFKQDGKTPNTDKSFRSNVQRREMAKPETAEWVGREFKAQEVYPKPYLGGGEAFDINEESVQQYHVRIQGVEYVAGHIAYYFTVRPEGSDPNDPAQRDAGMWPADMAPDAVMIEGKKQADKWIASGQQYKE